jgi:hypothetical protein
MTECPWERISKFSSPDEYDRFVAWIDGAVSTGDAIEEAVAKRYAGDNLNERWFRHPGTGVIWRLVAPDAPFYGVFEPVND